MVHCEGFGHKKCEILWLTLKFFFFFIKTKKMIFREATMTIIGEKTTKCLQCIKYDAVLNKNAVLYLFSPKIGPFVKVIHRSLH